VEDVFVPPDAGEVRRTCTFRMNAPARREPPAITDACGVAYTGQDPNRVAENVLLDPAAWRTWMMHAWAFGIVVGES